MPDYFCRITTSSDSLTPLWDKLMGFDIIAYEHKENLLNIHVHFLIKNCTLSTDTLKNYVRKITGTKFKATDWSFKTVYKPHKDASEIPVNDGCITYMSKGHLQPCYKTGFGDTYIEDFKLKWLDYKRTAKQSSLTQYLVKESQAKSKLRQNDMIDEIAKRFELLECQDISNLVKTVRQVVIVENKTVIGRYKIRDYCDTILARTQPERWLSAMTSLITEKNFYI